MNKISSYVCQAIITIQEQQPELLLEKYRNVQWLSSPNQCTLTAKFTEILGQASDWDALLQRLKVYLKALLIPESFNSPILVELITKIRQLNLSNTKNLQLYTADNLVVSSLSTTKTGIAVLLLDAENLHLNLDTEKFLTTVCTFPIQIKIAFANWCSMGKRDAELHQRSYELIHVPVGKDNADGKMIAFGSSVHERYLNVKEVLVCSSDKVMTNLCNHLHQNGLTVYQVSKQGENLTVLNTTTGQLITQLTTLPEIPTIEQFIQQIKELIKAEQKRTQICWVKLAKISQSFKDKYHLTINQIISRHFPGKKARDIFTNYPADFVIHQIDEASELYVTLFEINQSQLVNEEVQGCGNSAYKEIGTYQKSGKSVSLANINSQADLEQALNKIIKGLTQQSPESYVYIGMLGSKFSQQYGKPITEQIKHLKMSGNFIKFLHSCSSLKLKQTEKGWVVTAH